MNVLVLGATGCIGRAVARELVVNSYRVFGLVRGDEAKARLPYAVIGVKGDLRHPEGWEHALEHCDVVVNAAFPDGLVPPGPMDRPAAEAEAEAYAGILDRFFDFMNRRKKLLVHTFGALLYEPEPDGWVREVSAISAGRGFGIRHQVAWPVFAEHRRHGLKAMSVNPAFVYGRGGWFEHGMLDGMLAGRSTILGDGKQVMHYVAAADAAAAYRLAIEKGKPGEDYLIADDEPVTQGDFVRLVAKELGAPEPVCVPEAQLAPVLGDWALEAYTTCYRTDATKAHRELGWRPRFRTIAEGVPFVVREYRRSKLAPATAR
jgi:nucleoside-diphosphate-sugar epimerase